MNMIYIKPLKDLWFSKSKTYLVLSALIIGIFGLSTIIYTNSITKRDLKDNYLQTQPASVVLNIENFTPALLDSIEQLDVVSHAETRDMVVLKARSHRGFNWMPVYIFAIPDFLDVNLNIFKLEKGNFPKRSEVAIERDGMPFLSGEELIIQVSDNKEVILNQTAEVHDPGLPPSHMDHILWAYVSQETFDENFNTNTSNRLLVRFQKQELSAIQRNTEKVIQIIQKNDGQVLEYTIPPPNQHPHEGQLQSLLFLQMGMGGLAILLSIILLFNVINSLMSEQIRQIGIMKATGASQKQLIVMYTFGVIVLSIISLLIALPLGYEAALAYSHFIAKELNFDVLNAAIPMTINAVLIIMSLLFPIIATLIPVMKVSSISVKEALQHQNNGAVTKTKPARYTFSFMPLWFNVAQNNTFLNKSRLGISIFTLMLGLGLYAIGLNVSASLANTFQGTIQKKSYDFTINLKGIYSKDSINQSLLHLPSIVSKELWMATDGSFVNTAEVKVDHFKVVGCKENSKMWKMQFLQGTMPTSWEESIVMNPEFARKYPNIKVGNSINLSIGGSVNTWYVAGIVADIGPSKIFTTSKALRNKTTKSGLNTVIKVKAKTSNASYNNLMLKTESVLEKHRIYVAGSLNQSEYLSILEDHISVILSFLLAMATLVLIIGGLGIISLMNINVMERKRDIGIMRATGANNWQITRIIAIEMIIIGLISWLLAWLLSIPVSKIISNFFGKLILETPLDYASNPKSLGITFLVMLGVLLLSAYFPVRNALKMEIKEALK